ncbi:MAG TPA: SDR family oxidoreductase [Clostridia bacterium]|nr:SDR family oxidoreductase [Clostridia bacterium]
MNLFDLSGKKAIVTGGSRGLGRAMAEGLHNAGAEVVIIATSDSVFKTAEEIGSNGAKVYGVKGNLSDRTDLTNAFNNAVEALGDTLDILVNAAGITRRTKCEDYTIEDWDSVIETNLTAVFSMCQLSGRIMIKKGKGKIINVASLASFFGGITICAYSASKGGVAQITKSFANEWGSKGININAIAPGYFVTDLNTGLMNDPVRSEKIITRIPAGRWGIPEDIQGITVFLASEASNYINGTVIPVDGGYLGF